MHILCKYYHLTPLYHHYITMISPIPNLNIWIFQDGQITSAIHNCEKSCEFISGQAETTGNNRKQHETTWFYTCETKTSIKNHGRVNQKKIFHIISHCEGPMMQALFPDAVHFFPRTNWTGWSFDIEYSCSDLACDQMMTLLEKL